MKKRRALNFLWVAAGGSVGALLRYFSDVFIGSAMPDAYLFTPIMFVNIAGSYFMGLLYFGFAKGKISSQKLELFFITGLIASFTTYSGYGVESLVIFREFGFIFLIYILSQFVLGVSALILGLWTGRKIFSGN